ncbi:MAG: hypothetical protein Q3990_08295 [Desulfovibrionaceae bacterium]|nr:hypothetical protein [Desulfovibrionaceae bacterium]
MKQRVLMGQRAIKIKNLENVRNKVIKNLENVNLAFLVLMLYKKGGQYATKPVQ